MYTDHYGLSGQPFQLTPDARFWFDSRTHRKAMAYLGYGLAQGEGFITVTGEIGAGKSTLVAHLMANIDRSRLNAISLVSTQVEGDDMLRLVAQGLGLNTGAVEKARLLDAVEQRLGEELRAGKRTLLVVDEAQNLPVSALEELRMLSNFQHAGKALLQIVLLGQPEFRDQLAGPGLEQLRQRVIATHHLEAMGEDEVEAYIRHRLTRVDWQGNPDFDMAAIAAIHRHSGGIPRKVNQLAHRLLLHAAIENAELLTAEAVEAVAAEMGADAAAPAPAREEKVLPLRSARLTAVPQAAPAPAPVHIVPDPELERRIAALEARAEEHEAMLRRVLVLLVDWVESSQDNKYRTHAA
ncbi:MAG TPA: XrtA/PEP-CTERM system-associated ATPase [Allosphingosinicella sp.]|nr:XrtA/PEP-CTERM system-associated ATPase [Allosphingosinicella sp.]